MRKRKASSLMTKVFGEPIQERILLNIGLLQDIATATFKVGDRGETIILGGSDLSTSFVGPGNSYKSTLAFYMFLTVLDRYADIGNIYDSEINMKRQRIVNLSKNMKDLHCYLLEDFDSIINLQSKTNMFSDTWWDKTKEICELNTKSKLIVCDGLRDSKGEQLTMPPILTTMLDSITEAEPAIANDILSKSKVEDASSNMYFMRSGLWKSKMLGELPMYSFKGNNRIFLTAHTGMKSTIGENKYSKPDPMLKELNADEIIKGVSSKFSFLISTVYKNSTASTLKNQATKMPEYPTKTGSMYPSDLSVVKIKILRCKSGATGVISPIVVSQTEGVLPSLTEFHYIKKKEYHPEQGGDYGISGSNVSYSMDLYPSVSLSRTKVRDRIENYDANDENALENDKLRRAINITSELLQLSIYHGNVYDVPPMKDIHERLISFGYDWDELLLTRGWYSPENYNIKDMGKYLSSIDIMNMYNGTYIPFWLDKTKTKVVKENIKKFNGK